MSWHDSLRTASDGNQLKWPTLREWFLILMCFVCFIQGCKDRFPRVKIRMEWVNGLHLSSAFQVYRPLKALYNSCQHSDIHKIHQKNTIKMTQVQRMEKMVHLCTHTFWFCHTVLTQINSLEGYPDLHHNHYIPKTNLFSNLSQSLILFFTLKPILRLKVNLVGTECLSPNVACGKSPTSHFVSMCLNQC